jgi:hypothetical protein
MYVYMYSCMHIYIYVNIYIYLHTLRIYVHDIYISSRITGMLSSRYAGWGRGDVIGGRTLQEYCGKHPCLKENYTLDYSKKALTDLGLIEEGANGSQPHRRNKMSYGSLNVVWELRNSISNSITLGKKLS